MNVAGAKPYFGVRPGNTLLPFVVMNRERIQSPRVITQLERKQAVATTLEGTACLIWPAPAGKLPWWQFWRRHRRHWEEAVLLQVEVSCVGEFCQRLVDYVSADLYWVTPDGAAPLVFDAVGEALRQCHLARRAHFDEKGYAPHPGAGFRLFFTTAMDHAAARLSTVSLASREAVWLPAAGKPLQPWLVAQPPGIINCRSLSHDPRQEARVREALEAHILTPLGQRIFGSSLRKTWL